MNRCALETAGGDVNAADAVQALQNEVHILLNDYLNGYDHIGKKAYLFPLGGAVKGGGVFGDRVRRILWLREALGSRGEPTSRPRSGRRSRGYLARLIATTYEDLEGLLERLPDSTTTIRLSATAAIRYDPVRYPPQDWDYLWPLTRLVEKIRSDAALYLREMYLHGSLSTLDYSLGFSDVDTLLILKREACTSPEGIEKLRGILYPLTKYFFLIDPMQHHGFFIITETDTSYYPETYFPLELFKYSSAVLSNGEVPFRVRPSGLEAAWAVKSACAYFQERRKDRVGQAESSLFTLKFMISLILVLPALYLQAVDAAVYKRESFARFYEMLPASREAIEVASAARLDWRLSPLNAGHRVASLLNPAIARKLRSCGLVYDGRGGIREEIERISHAGFRLSEIVLADLAWRGRGKCNGHGRSQAAV